MSMDEGTLEFLILGQLCLGMPLLFLRIMMTSCRNGTEQWKAQKGDTA